MFRQTVNSTALCNDMANSFFEGRIFGDSFGTDVSMLSTLRAFVYPRMKDGDKLELHIGTTTCNAANLTGHPAEEVLRDILSSYDLSKGNQFIVHGFRGISAEATTGYMALVDSEFTKRYKGYKPVEKIEAFYKKSFGVKCFVNAAKKSTIIFVNGMDMRRLHYLQCCVLVAVPWYFDPSKGLTEDERALVTSFKEASPEAYLTCIDKMARQYDFRTTAIRSMLDGVEKRFIKQQRDRLAASIKDAERNIEDIFATINAKYKERDDLMLRLLGMEEAINRGDSGESELVDYFICNRNLVLDHVDGSTLHFRTIADLTQFDPEMAERQIKNARSTLYMYGGSPRSVEHDDMYRLMKAIFIDATLTVRFCGSYRINLATNSVEAVRGADYSGADFIHCMPNPHIDGFSCLGNNKQQIIRFLSAQNYVGAIDQCLASCSNLNFADSTVMNRFVDKVCSSVRGGGAKCVRLPDGTYTDFKGALEYLKSDVSVDA